MKAVRFHEYGDPGVLVCEEVERPVPGPGEVRLQVAATTFNPIDAGIRAGARREPFPVVLPHIPGIDVAGTVELLGEGVDTVAIGDEVVSFLPMVPDGASAEYVIAPAQLLARAPSTIPLADAAALPSVGLAAWQSLFEYGELAAGQRVLISGAGGAVGGYAVQLAKRAGAHVIATASSGSRARVRAAGADQVIDYTTTDVVTAVTSPVDLVVNLAPIEPEQLAALTGLVRPGGIVAILTLWMDVPSDDARGVRGVGVVARSDAGQLSRLVELIDQGQLEVEIAERVGLADLGEVHARADGGALRGKVLVLPSA
jgi:NADPH:quinone reductase-like Zn-dependent oxidoreductase